LLKTGTMAEPYNTNDYFKISDLAMAAAISLFMPIEAINRQNPQRVEFVFERSRRLEKILRIYWRNEMKVEPKEYFSQLKNLKSRLYGQE